MILSNEEIEQLLVLLDKESRALRKEIYRLCWHLRGGMSIDEGFMLGLQDREIIGEVIKENFEMTKKLGIPQL